LVASRSARGSTQLGSDSIDVVSPHTGEVVGRVPHAAEADVDRAAAARTAFDSGDWPRLTPTERGKIVGQLADAYQARMEEMAQLITLEMSSPISFSRFVQAAMPVGLLRYYAGSRVFVRGGASRRSWAGTGEA
jgi:aldehyde dehydrogenase (NAD+)